MLNFSKIKVVLIYLSFLAVSFFCFSNISDSNNFFLKKKINLGLDLQGGSYLLLEVDSTPLQKRQIQSKVIPLKKKLWKGRYLGQRQKWFVMKFYGNKKKDINLNVSKAEFSDWKWVHLNKLVDLIVPFKKKMYQEIIKEFELKINNFS